MGEPDLHRKNAALLVIDMQNDFILPSSPIHLQGAEGLVPNVVKAVEVARNRGIHVIWVVREHDPQGRDVELLRRHMYDSDKPKPVSKGSHGAQLADGLLRKECDYKLVKTRFSAFFNTNLHSYLQALGVHNLVITGIQTPNCIGQTVFDAVSFDYSSIAVIVDATGAATPDIHNPNILDMWRHRHWKNGAAGASFKSNNELSPEVRTNMLKGPIKPLCTLLISCCIDD